MPGIARARVVCDHGRVSTLYDFEVETLTGDRKHLSEYRGKVLLVVNTASKCGFTPQYAELEELYKTYRDRGLLILGFPCNQFGKQEPGTADEIGEFCQLNYGVSFPMHAKIEVNGKAAHPLYQHLKNEAPGVLGTRGIKWNFTKFLVGRDGQVISRFAPAKSPMQLVGEIEKALG